MLHCTGLECGSDLGSSLDVGCGSASAGTGGCDGVLQVCFWYARPRWPCVCVDIEDRETLSWKHGRSSKDEEQMDMSCLSTTGSQSKSARCSCCSFLEPLLVSRRRYEAAGERLQGDTGSKSSGMSWSLYRRGYLSTPPLTSDTVLDVVVRGSDEGPWPTRIQEGGLKAGPQL